MRDKKWLEGRFEEIWNFLFNDIEKKDKVSIKWEGKWQNKFGHITKKFGKTEIAINGLFRSEKVPEFVIDLTIAHELVHYMHGFFSKHDRKHVDPHAGNVVNRELAKRGFGVMMRKEEEWVRKNWGRVYSLLNGNL